MLSCGDIIAATLALHIYNDDVWELILLHYNPLLSGQFLRLEIYIAYEGCNISLYSIANSLSHLITDYYVGIYIFCKYFFCRLKALFCLVVRKISNSVWIGSNRDSFAQ